MKRFLCTASLVALIASPALALEITNLADNARTVLFRTAGTTQRIDVPAGDTVRIAGQTNGFLTLLKEDGSLPKKDNDLVHTDGILSGLIASARTSDIPADAWDAFVIWQDGSFGVQQHRRGGHRFN